MKVLRKIKLSPEEKVALGVIVFAVFYMAAQILRYALRQLAW